MSAIQQYLPRDDTIGHPIVLFSFSGGSINPTSFYKSSGILLTVGSDRSTTNDPYERKVTRCMSNPFGIGS